MDRYKNLEKSLCRELERLDSKYNGDMEMNEEDVRRADLLYHALKSAETYHAMKDSEEEDERSYRGRSYAGNGNSYARGRDMRTGRYISRDMDYSGGRYPMEYIDPYWDRRY